MCNPFILNTCILPFCIFLMFICVPFCDEIYPYCSTVLLIKHKFSSLVLECILRILKSVGYQRNLTFLRVHFFGMVIFMLLVYAMTAQLYFSSSSLLVLWQLRIDMVHCSTDKFIVLTVFCVWQKYWGA